MIAGYLAKYLWAHL